MHLFSVYYKVCHILWSWALCWEHSPAELPNAAVSSFQSSRFAGGCCRQKEKEKLGFPLVQFKRGIRIWSNVASLLHMSRLCRYAKQWVFWLINSWAHSESVMTFNASLKMAQTLKKKQIKLSDITKKLTFTDIWTIIWIAPKKHVLTHFSLDTAVSSNFL